MKKFLPLIERYVQWVALGLGALYVFYMVYAYVIVPPVTTEVGNRTVDLGSVDKVTREGPGADMERAIQTGASADAIGQINVQPVVPKFVATITNANDALAKMTLDASNWNAPVLPPVIPGMPGATPGRPTGIASTGGPNAAPPQVAEIVVPAATFVGVSTGRSSVIPPPPPANGGVAAGGNPAAQQPAPVQPIQPVQQIQPVQGGAVAGAVNPNNPNNVPTVDKNWVSFHYKIPAAGLNEAFQKAGVPSVRRVTSFLRVELVRQEKLPGGDWGEAQTVQPLQIAFQNAPVWPANPAAGPQAEQDYITWAQANAQSILQPVFYQVVKGDIPGVPGDPVLHVGMPLAQDKPFDPANPGRPPTGGFTAEQRQAIIDYRKQKAQEQRQNRQTHPIRRPTRGGRGGEDGGDIAFAPRDAARPTAFYQVRTAPGYRRPGVDVPEDMVMEDAGDGMGGAGVVTQQNNEALNRLAQTIPQPNLFDPAQLTVDVDVIAYDETAEPGKTYRYRMQYYVLNPILGAINLVKNPQQAKAFSIASLPSEWSAPVDITPSVNFFLAAGGLVGDSVKLDIFKWQNGDVNKATQTVTAGDRVGLTDKNGMDFMTPWTIVDVRVGNGDRYVLLQDEKGNTMRREFKVDQNNPLHRDLDAQVSAAQAAAAAAAAAANPNGVPGGIQPTGGNFTR